ncbi:MAG: hypothetical protein WAV47_03410 [Blastocatellia bacterium]
MQTVMQVVCGKGKSLRDAIANDPRLHAYNLRILRERKPGRSPGWTKLKSTLADRRGTINIQWNASTATLMCRVVNRGAGRPHLVVGDLVDYLLDRHKRRLKLLTIWLAN